LVRFLIRTIKIGFFGLNWFESSVQLNFSDPFTPLSSATAIREG
jgi:hypothetical protein